MPGKSKKGGGLEVKNMAYWKDKYNSTPLPMRSPTKHSSDRYGHENTYGKGHDNSAHPNYWKGDEKSKETTRTELFNLYGDHPKFEEYINHPLVEDYVSDPTENKKKNLEDLMGFGTQMGIL